MKTNLLLVLSFFSLTHLAAQNYYKIVFSGEPETVLVENLTKGTTVSIQGTDTLHLNLEGTSVNEPKNIKSRLNIYPNPMDHSCNFDFENTQNGPVVIQIYQTQGSLVHEYNHILPQGIHNFQLLGVPNGIYAILVKTSTYQVSGSFVSTIESTPGISLLHKNISPFYNVDDNDRNESNDSRNVDTPISFRSVVEMDFTVGDQLKFVGYATGSENDIVYASPTGDQTINFTFCRKPAQPSEITGSNQPCQGGTEQYSVTGVPNVTYLWIVPTGWTITSSQNSSITVTVGSTGGNITVIPSNDCGIGTTRTLAVTTQLAPQQPSIISGNTSPCQGTTENYSVADVPGVTFNWTLPAGWTITSGQGTNNITVLAGAGSGNMIVTPSAGDCNGIDRTLTIYTQVYPVQPSEIIGSAQPCQGATENYSVNSIPGMTYLWIVPTGWTITSNQNSSITVTVGTSNGNITVIPSNNCGVGTARSLGVNTQLAPEQPSVISGNTSPCQGTTGNYSVIHVPGLTYTWVTPIDWSITSGQGTNSITVFTGGASGNMTVTPSVGNCFGAERALAINTQVFPTQPSEITGNPQPCQGATENYSVSNIPGMTYLWIVPTGWTIISSQNASITVTVGSTSGIITVIPSNNCGIGTDRTFSVTTEITPDQPSPINGNINPCQNEIVNYSVVEIPGMTYTWTVPSDWMIISGQNTNSIDVIAGANSGNITVIPYNDCGNGISQTMAVMAQPVPTQPSFINGNDNPCQWETGLNYFVTNESGINYTWTVPADWVITSGQNTHSIMVNAGTYSGNITVFPSNDCGVGYDQILEVSTQIGPDQPSPISGVDQPCEGTIEYYSVIEEPGVLYFWSVPAGWNIISGQNYNSISLVVGSNSGLITVTPSNDCGNGTAQTFEVTARTVPDQPSPIAGDSNPCQNTTDNYSVPNDPDVTYTWTFPSGWIVTSGQGTNSVTVTVGSSSGNITVIPSNDCGNGTSRILSVSVQLIPAQPSPISGSNNPCGGASGLSYSVTNVSGVSYFWTVPSGWTIASGQGTNNIQVNADLTSGNITVTPSNDCGTGTSRVLSVSLQSSPAQPSQINGSSNPCGGTTGITYSVINVSGVTYLWTVPSGWTIVSGQGTNSITVNVGSTSGNITVTPSNDCGNGTSRVLSVWVQFVPSQPSPISGTNNPCGGMTGLSYSVNLVSGVTYFWTVPSSWTIVSGQGTNSILVNAGLTSGNIIVTPSNDCGNGNARSISVSTQVTFTYNGSSVTYGTVTSINNRCWLDRNLGATQVATSSSDAASYGHLFQWGRLDDGHQVRTSPTTTTLSSSNIPGHGNFILALNSPLDWRSPQNNNLWQGVNGSNNPCPNGYRLATSTEWDAERLSWITNNAAGAFASPLKLPLAGSRNLINGTLQDMGGSGSYWSSNVNSILSVILLFYSNDALIYNSYRAEGLPVRCTKD